MDAFLLSIKEDLNDILSSPLEVVLIVLAVVLVWKTSPTLLSYLTGWRHLRKVYTTQNENLGNWKDTLSHCRIGRTVWRNTFIAKADRKGVYLSIPKGIFKLLFTPRTHPPLFIPWEDIEVKEAGILFSRVVFRFKDIPFPTIAIDKTDAINLLDEGGKEIQFKNEFSKIQ